MNPKPLGLIPLEDNTIEHDFTVLARFQDFSAEILRLSLLGIGAIGFAVSKLVLPESGQSLANIGTSTKWLAALSLFAFCAAAIGALFHRYVSSDSMSWQLTAVRSHLAAGDAGEKTNVDKEAKDPVVMRDKRFDESARALAAASIFLGVATFALAFAVADAIFR